MKNILTIIMIFLSIIAATAQSRLSGMVRNSSTKESVSYITIGVAGKASGAITDTLGSFEIKLNEMVTPQDSVVFVGLGYERFSLCVSDFAENEEILLTPKSY